ncbi:MAG: EAL domain-containing protein [Gammaproteobacteria bacterium]|nr:EAL domain-containing protein [Gammaproteobacteria bacterium]
MAPTPEYDLSIDLAEPAAQDTLTQHARSLMAEARIVMVDDEPIMTEVVQTFLEDVGCQNFLGINDSRLALREILAYEPDALLLDLMMPHVSGFDLLQAVRSTPALQFLPVIVMTAASDSNTKLQALELGATDFLQKPVDASELHLRLRNTLAYKQFQDRQANLDPLTGLPNRKKFMADLAAMCQSCENRSSGAVLLHIDLDRFGRVNDSLGMGGGDQLLKEFARRLEVKITELMVQEELPGRDSMLSARLTADEFAVMIPFVTKAKQAEYLARKILGFCEKPFRIDDAEVFVSTSIGIALAPGDGDSCVTLLHNAVSATKVAKQRGRNSCAFFSPDINQRSVERLSLETALRRAIERNEMQMYYQPKVSLRTGAIIGAEALIRWLHPVRGLVTPAEFIPLAEESGLIKTIGNWVLNTACAQQATLARAGYRNLEIAINLSPIQLMAADMIEQLRGALAATGAAPSRIILEITESVLLEQTRQSAMLMNAMHDEGVRISLDDFGTGYSSLSYLKQYPIDELKIDRSFVSTVIEDKDNGAIVNAVVALAHCLGLTVTAEGVENEAQRDFLAAGGCDSYQGFLVARPLPHADFMALLNTYSGSAGSVSRQAGFPRTDSGAAASQF